MLNSLLKMNQNTCSYKPGRSSESLEKVYKKTFDNPVNVIKRDMLTNEIYTI